MINAMHLTKVAAVWMSIAYAICYVGVVIFPSIRDLFMRYALHADVAFQSDFFSFGYFISGLIIWDILAISGAWLFAVLFNKLGKD